MAEAIHPKEREILVENIPYVTDDIDQLRNKLEIYFGKSSNGGGDVDYIICPLGGSIQNAIVVFASGDGKHFCIRIF